MPIGPESLRLSAELRALVDSITDSQTRALVAAWARALDQIGPVFLAASDEIVGLVTDGRWPTPAQVARSTRVKAALAVAEQELARLATAAGVNLTGAIADLIAGAVPYTGRIIASQYPSTAGDTATLAAQFDRARPEALQAIVTRTTQQITALTYPISAEATEAIRQQLVRGIAVGDNPRTTAYRMVGAVEGRFNGGLTRALTIARTETLSAHNEASRVRREANADVLTGWVWTSTADARTCPACWAESGSVHPVDEPGPYGHQNCRCTALPLAKTWRDLGFDIDEPPSALVDRDTAWAALSDTDKLSVMGPKRLELLQSGQVSWEQLSTRRTNPGWRDSITVTPLRDLVAA